LRPIEGLRVFAGHGEPTVGGLEDVRHCANIESIKPREIGRGMRDFDLTR